ncbi:MAG: hypothetical protein R3F49_16695 [Planctomycetota bacterium]
MPKSFLILSVVLLSTTPAAKSEQQRSFPIDADAVSSAHPVVTNADLDDTLQRICDADLGSVEAYEELLILQSQVAQWVADQAELAPDPTTVGSNLQSAIEAVIASARAGFMTHFEAAFLREQVIEARLDVLLEQLVQRARSSGLDADVFSSIVAQLETRARAAIGYPDPEAARARLQAIVRQMQSAQQLRAADVDALRLELLRNRMSSYFEFLGRRARSLGVSREEAMPVIQMAYERAHLSARSL